MACNRFYLEIGLNIFLLIATLYKNLICKIRYLTSCEFYLCSSNGLPDLLRNHFWYKLKNCTSSSQLEKVRSAWKSDVDNFVDSLEW